jgi:hypothetical protein
VTADPRVLVEVPLTPGPLPKPSQRVQRTYRMRSRRCHSAPIDCVSQSC